MTYRKSIILTAAIFIGLSASQHFFKGINPMTNYREEIVQYQNNTANITLEGTLTIPLNITTKPPVIILIAGYGKNDRNLSYAKEQFKVIAEHFSNNGIACLRYDKRGVGKSTGNFDTATTYDFAQDARAGVTYLKTRTDIDTHKIGLMGHSEGGLMASIIASESTNIAFIILSGAAVLTNVHDFIKMSHLQMKADGASEHFLRHDGAMREKLFFTITQINDCALAETKLRTIISHYLSESTEEEKIQATKLHFAITEKNTDAIIKTFNSTWYRYFLSCNPPHFLQKVTVPTLAINGSLDWIAYPGMTFPIMKQALSHNHHATFVEMPGLNHSLQTCATGAMAEYMTNEETIAPSVLELMTSWIIKRYTTKK